MEGKTLLASGSPITQSIDAVKSLLAYVGRASDPLPTDVSFDSGRLVLVLNNKKDAYYTVTAKACSCPSAIYRHNGPCKHQRKYFAEQITKPAAREPVGDRIKPEGKWPGGFNGPVDPDTIKAESPKSSILQEMVIDCGHDTTLRDVTYWQKKQGQVV